MEELLARVRRYATRYGLLPSGEVIIVAVSGGADSLCLLDLLLRMSPEMGFGLHVAHLDHGLRGADSIADARFVASIAERWGLPCTVGRADVAGQAAGRSPEEAGRSARYTFLCDVARAVGAHTIATGHNGDDQAETVLMHFLRGAGVAGLRGMLPRTALDEYRLEAAATSELWLVRPLLCETRREIEIYCLARGLEPRFDRSNQDTSFYRNRLRHELLPLLEEYNPAIREVLTHTAAVMAGDYEIARTGLEAAWRQVAVAGAPGEAHFDVAGWRALPIGLQRATVREAIHLLRRSLRDINWEHIERAVWLAREGRAGQAATLAAGLELRIGSRSLRIAPEGAQWRAASPQLAGRIALKAPGTTQLADGWRVEVTLTDRAAPGGEAGAGPSAEGQGAAEADPWTAFLDADAVGPDPALRPREPGEWFQPQGLGGHRVRLNEFMINRKTPRCERSGWPLLEGALGLAWVCGLRVDERAAVKPTSRRVWRVRLEREGHGGGSGAGGLGRGGS